MRDAQRSVKALIVGAFLALLVASVPPAFGSRYASVPLPLALFTFGLVLHLKLAPRMFTGDPSALRRIAPFVGYPFMAAGGTMIAQVFADFPPGIALAAGGPAVLATLLAFRVLAIVPRIAPWRRLEVPAGGLATIIILTIVSLPLVAERHVVLLEWGAGGLIALSALLTIKNMLGEQAAAASLVVRRHEPRVAALPDAARVAFHKASMRFLAGRDVNDYQLQWDRILSRVHYPETERRALLSRISGAPRDQGERTRLHASLVSTLDAHTLRRARSARPTRVKPHSPHPESQGGAP